MGTAIEEEMRELPIGKGRLLSKGSGVAILNFGTLLAPAMAAAERLGATLADMRWVKPLDEALIDELADSHQLLVTIEENTVAGGAGSAVMEYLNSSARTQPVLQLGLPDRIIEHGKHKDLLAAIGLNAEGIEEQIRRRLQLLNRHNFNDRAAAAN